MIRATMDDIPAIEAFLRAHIATSMFPLVNLLDHGMVGGHPRAVTCWLRWQAGRITDVLTVTEEGMLYPQCPTGPWGDAAVILAGSAVKGALGETGQVAALRAALRLPAEAELDTVEPLYRLSLGDLRMPDFDGYALHPITEVPRSLIEGWRADYNIGALNYPEDEARAQAKNDVATYLARDSHRVLLEGETPVAMTGFNATLPDVVQVGGVYTPPALRRRGYARRAVALHLTEARAAGAKDAILFAANAAAAKAYEAIGFRQIGRYSIAIHAEYQVIHG